MSKKTYDPIAPWFVAAESLGEFIGIRFGRIAPRSNRPEWIFLRHADYDGIGGFAKILREKGVALESLPQIKHGAPPSIGPLLKMLPKFLLPHQRVGWKPFADKTARSSSATPPPAVAWHIFDEPTTLQIRQVSRQAGITLNTLLLKHLTTAIRPFLRDELAAVPWMIPINLRGKVARDRDTANFSSYISVTVRPADSGPSIHKKIYAALDRGEHWGNWHAYKLGRFNTHGIKRFLLAKEWATSQWNIGGFSNLGDWDPEKKITHPDCLGDWLFSPPVLRFQKIGAGCVTFQNRLGLLIQAHPELTVANETPGAWMQNWITAIQAELAGH